MDVPVLLNSVCQPLQVSQPPAAVQPEPIPRLLRIWHSNSLADLHISPNTAGGSNFGSDFDLDHLPDSAVDGNYKTSPEIYSELSSSNNISGSQQDWEISEQNKSILDNAFTYNNNPTHAERQFLAACLGIDNEILDHWRSFSDNRLRQDSVQRAESPSQIARWKHKIIERGMSLEKSPSNHQIDFLAAGLRLDTALLRRTFENSTRDAARQKESFNSDIPGSHAVLLGGPSVMEKVSQESPTPQLAREAVIADSQDSESSVTNKLKMRSTNDGDTLLDDMDFSRCRRVRTCGEEVTSVLGPEYAHLALALVGMFPYIPEEALPPEDGMMTESRSSFWSSSSELSGTSGGSSCTPSASGYAPSSSNTVSSNPRGNQKRRLTSNGGSGDDGKDQLGDGDEDEDRSSKRAKTAQTKSPRYDCPIARRAIYMGKEASSSRACAPGGLEFRNVWDHMMKAHFGCEKCGKKLSGQKEATVRLFESKNDPQMCQPATEEIRYEIGIGLWMKLEEIYKDKNLNHHQKWIQWWDLLCPGADEPDPLHYDTVSLSIADIPRVQKMMEKMWEETPSLPALSVEQKGQVAIILEKVLQVLPRVHRARRQKTPPLRQKQRQQQEDWAENQQQELQQLQQDPQLSQLQQSRELQQPPQEENQQHNFLDDIGFLDNMDADMDCYLGPNLENVDSRLYADARSDGDVSGIFGAEFSHCN